MAQGMILRRGGGGTSGGLPEFAYTGNYTLIDDGNKNWRIKFLTSGTFTPARNITMDVFIVGGGAGGINGASGHNGGGGGGGRTAKNTSIVAEARVPYPIIIGSGGAANTDGGNTSAFGYLGNGGSKGSGYNGGAGGSGGGAGRSKSEQYGAGGENGANGASTENGTGGNGQGTTTREFGDAAGTLYATGGSGSNLNTANPQSANPNTGDGGQGSKVSVTAGSGGSGIVVIRNARAA